MIPIPPISSVVSTGIKKEQREELQFTYNQQVA